MIKHSLFFALLIIICLPSQGQIIAAFSGTKTPEAVTIPNLSAKALSRGPGLTVAGGNTFNSGNWATDGKLDLNDYIEWSVTAEDGYIIQISELQINLDRDPDGISHFFTGNGPAKIRIRTSLDHFKSDLYAHDKISNSGQSPSIETHLKSDPGGTITFRLYGYAANIGMLGPLGTLDIEGGLGTVLGLENTGIILSGVLTYDGLLYKDGTWTPYPPDKFTASKNAMILNGNYNVKGDVQLKNLTINTEAQVAIEQTGSITVYGDLFTANKLQLKSGTDQFSSLIVKGKVSGTAEYQRHVEKTTMMGSKYHNTFLISAPVTGQRYKEFREFNVGGKFGHKTLGFAQYNKVKKDYITLSHNETDKFKPAEGYKITASGNNELKYTGAIMTEEISKDISNSGAAHSRWNLIGNPYPSYIRLADFLNTNISSFDPSSAGIYIMDDDAVNSWRIKNLAYLTLYPHAKIEPGQGFMVASNSKSATMTFTPDMRTIEKLPKFGLRTSNTTSNVGYLKLNLSNGFENFSTEFYFNDASTLKIDPGYDASRLENEDSENSLFSKLVENKNSVDLAVQSLPYDALSTQIIIPLVVSSSGNKSTLKIVEAQLPHDIDIYLEDRMETTYTLLNTSNYTFQSAKKHLKDRFYLHIVKNTLNFGSDTSNIPQLYTTNHGHTLHIKGQIDTHTSLSILDLQERLIFQKVINDNRSHNLLDLSVLANGTYIVKLKNSSIEIMKKIIKTQF